MRGVVRSAGAARLGHSGEQPLQLLRLPGVRLVCAARAGPRPAGPSRRRCGQCSIIAAGDRAGRGGYAAAAGSRGGSPSGRGELCQAARWSRPAHEHQRCAQTPNGECPSTNSQWPQPSNSPLPVSQCTLCATGHWCTAFRDDPAGCNRHAVSFPNGSTALCQVKAGGGCESRFPAFVCPPPPPPAPPRGPSARRPRRPRRPRRAAARLAHRTSGQSRLRGG